MFGFDYFGFFNYLVFVICSLVLLLCFAFRPAMRDPASDFVFAPDLLLHSAGNSVYYTQELFSCFAIYV